MGDIDFEELDRAVSSALGGATKEEKPSPASDTLVGSARENIAEPQTDDTTSTAKKTLVQKRTTGRFMDVVHPSSDMKNQNKPTISRQAPDIQPPESAPASTDGIEEQPNIIADGADVEQKNEDVQAPESQSIEDEDRHTLPDPLDFHNFDAGNDNQDEEESSVSTVEDVRSNKDVLNEEDGELLDHDDDARVALDQVAGELSELDGLMQDQREMPPLDTPFVNDLAVEKRPLGAFSIGTEDKELAEEPTVEVNEGVSTALNEELADEDRAEFNDEPLTTGDVDAQTPAEAEVIPEELHEDLVAIESRGIEQTPQSVPSTTSVPEAAPSVVSGSIPQQYTEKPSTQTAEPTPVFDTNDYHQPLKHAEKKKSGWLIVIMIIVFILLGVGAGTAIYFFDPFGLLQ